jgi:hypothetical protein
VWALPTPHIYRLPSRIWAFFSAFVHVISTTILEDGINYLIEGDSIMPSHVSELSAAFPGQVRSCFIGYESAKPEEMLHRLRENDQLSDDWLNSYDDDWILDFIVSMIRHSKRLHIECLSLAIPYFDISTHFQEIHADILTYLQTGAVN